VRKPEVFLFDEPLSNLDAALRVRMRYEFAKLHEQFRTTMIYVTHDQVEAMTLATRIVVLSAGRIEQIGTPLELYEYPVNIFVAGFIGSPKMNFLEAEVMQADAQGATVRIKTSNQIRVEVDASSVKPGDKVVLGVRPEHFVVGAQKNAIQASINFVESLGSATEAYFVFPGSEDALTCHLAGNSSVAAGDVLNLGLPAEHCHLFSASGVAMRRHYKMPERRVA
jgi:multiple sugar transport system ATP-binding protein